MISDPPQSGQQTPEEEVERLAQDIGRLIRAVDPEKRDDLKELAFTLIREEMIQSSGGGEAVTESPAGPLTPWESGL